MDIKSINYPEYNQNFKKAEHYIYAGFLKPGYH